ncbi:isoaspartyl peptidase/L-asparaginase family protein [Pontibacter akesuensis]|uniref:Isoaspartyl peptidase n=1 Tax=Pontibacter akesuensis TaxID=388950 RepID=A0A1I7JBU7_9BACT|nr:isoaspartyl peptidase/L-asparaginase [Pontibacter akesuensis]GHA71110.1 isoaspartyl peptidase/L-asparaginase [Pontibacter akesuensis]SFU82660.1 beta-aspartyl-peptidase (threonine type) [Pontibacter akesuensis]
MKKSLYFLFLFLLVGFASLAQGKPDYSKITLAIHGGAGTITRENMTPEKEKAYREKLNEALQVGYDVLKKGGTSMDAVEATIHVMENSPLFNAGKGAVFTNEGKNEMDAAMMDGETLQAGAVASVTTIKNPISAARAVMEKSPHVMMIGDGAEAFAKTQGIELVDPSYFHTETRYNQLQQIIDKEKTQLDHDGGSSSNENIFTEGNKFGTVGCVALDAYGNLAAGTSTGGMTNKRFGRVGDAPIIGAGTYADNNTCAVSATGHGEYFIRNVVAYDIAALMKYKNLSVKKAAEEVVMKKLVDRGGEGGVIALDKNGNVAMPFNSAGMYRGYIKNGKPVVAIYRD